MPKLKNLSGEEIVQIFLNFGFFVDKQKGSHVKIKRMKDGSRQTLIVPLHKELDRGTISGIYKQALRYIPEENLKSHFYSE